MAAGEWWQGDGDLVFRAEHVHATTLLLAGVPVHVVAARLGHADPSITLRSTATVLREQTAGVADVFDEAIEEVS